MPSVLDLISDMLFSFDSVGDIATYLLDVMMLFIPFPQHFLISKISVHHKI